MHQLLINAIKRSDPEVIPKIFKDDFQRPVQWYNYLRGHFGSEPNARIETVLDKQPVKKTIGYDNVWHSKGFQALYIACWIYHPVEKGSFMIKLNPQQRNNAEISAGALTHRWSSHLQATSHSARGESTIRVPLIMEKKNFDFIKGYDELLVIVEGDFLFLKMEGHPASDISHLMSFRTKSKTGAGDVTNTFLHEAGTQTSFGITGRAAENYGKPYEKLLKKLRVNKNGKVVSLKEAKGNLVTIKDLLDALLNEFGYSNVEKGIFVTKYGLYLEASSAHLNIDGAITELSARGNTNQRLRELSTLLAAAKNDIRGIIEAAKKAYNRMGRSEKALDQIFHEVRVEPGVINQSLNTFMEEMADAVVQR